MELLTVYGLLVDDQNHDKNYHFFAKADVLNNKAVLCYIDRTLFEEGKSADDTLEELLHQRPQYHLTIYATALIRLVDTLGGIEIAGKKVNGEKTLELVKDGRVDEVANAIAEAFRNAGNIFFVLPNLLSILKNSYQTDLPILEVVKTVIGEAGQLDSYQSELYRVNKENAEEISAKLK